MKKSFFIILGVLALTACSPRIVIREVVHTVHDTVRVEVPVMVAKTYEDSWKGRVEHSLDSLCALPLMNESQVGVCIYDLTEGSVLYERNAQHRMRPASIMKVITSVTALSYLYDAPVFTTRAWYDEAGQRLVVKGAYDPLLDYNNLLELAGRLKSAGVTNIKNGLLLDATLSQRERWGKGWCWDDENEAMTPFIYKGEGAPRGQKGSSKISWAQDPETPFVKGLRKALGAKGITCGSALEIDYTGKKIPSDSGNASVCVSHLWHEVLIPMMKDSNNQFAESVLWQMGVLTGKACPLIGDVDNAFESLCDTLGLDASQCCIADGSGRSLYNYLTPEVLCRFLNHAALQPWFGMFRQTLPVMGVDGTLRNRCHFSSAQRRVQAKTGSVTGVSSLAGYIDASNGHLLCFAIINQGLRRAAMGRDWQDEVCRLLTR